MYEPKTIEEQIECLARLTGAPETFISQVKELFGRKGISLDDDAAPYLGALEEAFRREESIRYSTRRARQNIASMQQNFRKIGQAYVDQLSKQDRTRDTIQEQSRRVHGRLERLRTPQAHQVTIRGDHRTYVTRLEREELPMVPGPEDLQ